MGLLLMALALFLAEVRLAISSLHVPAEILAIEAEDDLLHGDAAAAAARPSSP